MVLNKFLKQDIPDTDGEEERGNSVQSPQVLLGGREGGEGGRR